MTWLGAPDEWLDLMASLVPDILALVRRTWQTMPPLAPDALEDPTTEKFCRRLRQSRTAAELPFRIDPQLCGTRRIVGRRPGKDGHCLFTHVANRGRLLLSGV